MVLKRPLRPSLVLLCVLVPLPALPDAPSFQVSESTPVGSWVEREHRTVDHKNRETVSLMRQTLVEATAVDDEPYYWVETVVTNYKVNKKGDRKEQGDQAIVKALVAQSSLDGDPANISNNLAGYGKELIFQTGDNQPMRIREGGMMGNMMMQALGLKVEYQITHLGNEKVETPAGTFDAEKFSGTGSTEARLLMNKISVQSEGEIWMSPDVPFGFVRMDSKETVNGKPQTSFAQVTRFGMDGGVSRITGEPMDMGGPGGGLNLKDLLPGGGG